MRRRSCLPVRRRRRVDVDDMTSDKRAKLCCEIYAFVVWFEEDIGFSNYVSSNSN